MRERLMTNTQYEIRCLSPVHIGTGRKFTRFDGFARDRQWWLIDLDKVLAVGGKPFADDLAIAMRDGNFAWVGWLQSHQLKANDVLAYSLVCYKDPAGCEVREGMKDIYQRPYIPGSSIKGAIRTALLWHLAQQQAPDFVRSLIRQGLYPPKDEKTPRKEWFAQKLERKVFGESVVTDLLKALHVNDSAPVALEQMQIGETATFTLRQDQMQPKGESFRIFAEWLKPETKLQLEIGVNDYLLSDEKVWVKDKRRTTTPRQELGVSDMNKAALEQLTTHCNAFALALLKREREFFEKHKLADLVVDCERIEKTVSELQANSFVLRLGWAGGWESKTIGDLVDKQRNSSDWRELRERFTLGQSPGRKDDAYLDYYFPHSRQLATTGPTPRALGWVTLEVL
ncbi:MAG: type III-A CRISPR-associated RAMP protein Csm5 [Acidobacteria bacterium]|nr:type III-A CRISPR-associated RAMP protein Csm5 [Acidobacteriota bacterium]